jgi:Predicted nucleic acid-binding protein, consists of a PIN domain and a Zn-ribbon module
MVTTYVLDTSAFIYGIVPGGEMETVPTVYAEVKDDRSRLKLELMEGLKVIEPEGRYVDRVAEAAHETGDDQKISKADGDLLALALQEKDAGKDTVVMTDDYAVQNVARRLGIRAAALRQKKSMNSVAWEKRCTGCGRIFAEGEECPVCGSPLRLKKRYVAGNRK